MGRAGEAGVVVARWLTRLGRLWFGLGNDAKVDRLDVKWPSGRSQSLANPAIDHIFEIEEGSDELRESGR